MKLLRFEGMTRGAKIFTYTFIVAMLYIGIAGAVYRLRHPELTDTQLFLDFFKALSWQ